MARTMASDREDAERKTALLRIQDTTIELPLQLLDDLDYLDELEQEPGCSDKGRVRIIAARAAIAAALATYRLHDKT